jgi:hypothetical protein
MFIKISFLLAGLSVATSLAMMTQTKEGFYLFILNSILVLCVCAAAIIGGKRSR